MADGGSCTVELLAFKSPAYVYAVPPARTAAGHRCARRSEHCVSALRLRERGGAQS